MFLRFSFVAVVQTVAQHLAGALFAANVEGNHQPASSSMEASSTAEDVRPKQRNAHFFGVNRRTVDTTVVNARGWRKR